MVAAPHHCISGSLWESSGYRSLSTTCSHGHFFLSSPDNQRCKGHVGRGLLFLSRKVYNVHVKHKKILALMIWLKNLMSSRWAEAYQGGSCLLTSPLLFADQLALSALLLFDFGLLRQVQICFQITFGYVAGKFSLEAAITRNSSCLSMLYRTGNLFCMHLTAVVSRDAVPGLLRTSAFQLGRGTLGCLHHFALLDSHLASAICCKLILKKTKGRENAVKMSFAFWASSEPSPTSWNSRVRLGAGALQEWKPWLQMQTFHLERLVLYSS